MRSPPTHDFRVSRDYHFPQRATSFVAIVDLDSYPAFVADHADRLDLLQHLCGQMQALTATMWETPEALLQLEVIWAPDDQAGERLKHTGHRGVADGYVRTDGHLCLMGDDQLFAGRRPRRDPRRIKALGDELKPHVLLVPPGVYGVSIFTGLASETGPKKDSTIGYTVVLRHHPHPAPRLHPVRLRGLASGESAPNIVDIIASHVREYKFS
jgi:hypothetical protein